MEKRRLGRGLEALLGPDPEQEVAVANGASAEVATTRIAINPHQPRKHFDADELAALTASVRSHGILQPLVVRRSGDNYELVAGERRLRAARQAGLDSVPVRVLNFNDQETLEAALIENLQRTDLNPIEKAHGFKDYLDRYGLTHDQLAQRLGLARSSITNLVNLLELPAELQEGLRLGQISEAHAKLIRGVKDAARQVTLFKQVVAMGLSVKATEQLVREAKGEPEKGEPEANEARKNGNTTAKTPHVRAIEDELRQRFALPVEIRLQSKDKGAIILRFDSNDDFERMLEMLRR